MNVGNRMDGTLEYDTSPCAGGPSSPCETYSCRDCQSLLVDASTVRILPFYFVVVLAGGDVFMSDEITFDIQYSCSNADF